MDDELELTRERLRGYIAGYAAGRASLEPFRALGKAIAAGDNACTKWPVWTVQEQQMVVGGAAEEYCHDPQSYCFAGPDGVVTAGSDPELFRELEELEGDGSNDTEWAFAYYSLEWVHVQAFLTESAAKQYVETQSHRHRGELRIYVDSAHRNPEWRQLQALLLGLASRDSED